MVLPFSLVKKVWRDFKNHKYQVLLLSIILGIGVGVVIGTEQLVYWRENALDESYASLNMMDFQIDLLQGSYANISYVEALIASIGDGLEAIEFRLVSSVGVNISSSSQYQIVQGKIIGINVTATRLESGTTRPAVNDYTIKNGDALTTNDAGKSVCLVQQAFADYHIYGCYGQPVSMVQNGRLSADQNKQCTFAERLDSRKSRAATDPGQDSRGHQIQHEKMEERLGLPSYPFEICYCLRRDKQRQRIRLQTRTIH